MESRLDPEAPEFRPGVTKTIEGAYSSVQSMVRSSNVMPRGERINWYGTFLDYNVVKYNMSGKVIDHSNYVMSWAGVTHHMILNDNEFNTEKLVDANDTLLDRVNMNIDTITGVNRPDTLFINNVRPNANVSAWNNQPSLSKIQSGSAVLLCAKNVPRPQIMFKDTIDNSETIWVPKITYKPNAIKPLELIMTYDDNGEEVGYEHPYKYELETYVPPKHFIDLDRSPPVFPAELEATPLTYIHTEAQLDQLVAHLTSVDEFAIDVEHHSYRTYQGITCLIQISTNEGGDFIIDTLSIREHIHKLNVAFTDPKKLKVLHGANNDVIWLQRDFGVYIVGLFDTYQAAKLLKITGLSLKSLLNQYCNINIDKRFQLADWRIRPLTEEMITYARIDTHYLLYIWRLLKQELLDNAQGQPALLSSVFELSKKICSITYNKPVVDSNSCMSMYVASQKKFDSRQLAALQMLYKWRDKNARLMDESPIYLLPNRMMMALAETLPSEVQGVAACCTPAPPFVNQNLTVMHDMISSCRELPIQPEENPMPAGIRAVVNQMPTSSTQQHLHDLPQAEDNDDQIDIHEVGIIASDEIAELEQPEPEIPLLKSPKYRVVVISKKIKRKAHMLLFNSPYDRYKRYRILAQAEELKQMKTELELKKLPIDPENIYTKPEVLAKLKKQAAEAAKVVETAETSKNVKKSNTAEISNTVEPRDAPSTSNSPMQYPPSKNKTWFKTGLNSTYANAQNQRELKVKPFSYTNINYRKFRNEQNGTSPSGCSKNKYKKVNKFK